MIEVVNAHAHERSQQVLDGFDRRAIAAQHRGVVHGRNVLHGGGNLDAQVGSSKNNPGISRGWLERQRDLIAGMKADSGA